MMELEQSGVAGFELSSLSFLDEYESHCLSDLKNAELMDRVDTKYLIPVNIFERVLESLMPYYTALEMDGKRSFIYHNTYFDTPDFDFYHEHHQGKLNRYKVRHRHYVASNKGFLEVKLKNNKGRTIKSRIESRRACIDGDSEKDFLGSIPQRFNTLKVAQWGSYERIALANEACGERLTLDMNVRFKSVSDDNEVTLSDFVVAELKQNKYDINSPFAIEMSRLGIRPSKFSKYCIGCSLVMPNLKSNRFKPVLTAMNKIINFS